jgi:hypothetical protein
MRRPQNSRDRALELVDEGIISAEDLLTAALKYMSTDDVEDMLDCNELSDRFLNDEEDDEECDCYGCTTMRHACINEKEADYA